MDVCYRFSWSTFGFWSGVFAPVKLLGNRSNFPITEDPSNGKYVVVMTRVVALV